MSAERPFSPEVQKPKNRFVSEHLEKPVLPFYQFTREPGGLVQYAADKSRMELGGATKVIHFDTTTSHETIASVIRISDKILPVGSKTALTAAASPDGDVVLDMTNRNKILEWGESKDGTRTVKVQTGLRIDNLKEKLNEHGLYYPPAPTWEEATIGGTIGTNAAGAATFKYGQTREWVEGITVILPNGELLEIDRGDCIAQDGKFEWQDASGALREIPVPTYKMPDVPKLSAGYYAKPDMDLVDLFIGAEGTLGVVTEAKLKIIEKPNITWAMIPCETEEEALALTGKLREHAKSTWKEQDAMGLDVSAIEYIDEKSVDLLRKDGLKRKGIVPPREAKTLLLVQMEMTGEQTAATNESAQTYLQNKFPDLIPDGELPKAIPDMPITRLLNELNDTQLENIEIATPEQQDRINYFITMREAVPEGVNQRILDNKNAEKAEKGNTTISKTAGDMIVPFEFLPDMMRLFREKFAEEYDMYIWGHVSDGNMHTNIVPKSSEQSLSARELLKQCGRIVIDEYKGSPCSEHGVGKNPVKQELIKYLYKELGIQQMRDVRRVFDPTDKMPQNIFALAA